MEDQSDVLLMETSKYTRAQFDEAERLYQLGYYGSCSRTESCGPWKPGYVIRVKTGHTNADGPQEGRYRGRWRNYICGCRHVKKTLNAFLRMIEDGQLYRAEDFPLYHPPGGLRREVHGTPRLEAATVMMEAATVMMDPITTNDIGSILQPGLEMDSSPAEPEYNRMNPYNYNTYVFP